MSAVNLEPFSCSLPFNVPGHSIMSHLIARLFPYQDAEYKLVEQVIEDVKATARFNPRRVEPRHH